MNYAIQVGYYNAMDKTITLGNIPIIHDFSDVLPRIYQGCPQSGILILPSN